MNRTPALIGMMAAALCAALSCVGPYADSSVPGDAPVVPIRDRHARSRIELLAAINEDRIDAGLNPVRHDSLATVVAQSHADAMAAGRFFSHYGLDGSAPYERLAAAGGSGHVRENVYRLEGRGGRPGELDVWERFDARDAQESLMDSPGHRETILDPSRTAVGMGIAVDESGRRIYVVQDFVARAALIDAPARHWARSPLVIEGRVRVPDARPLLVVVHRTTGPPEWVAEGGAPPGGAYADGRGEASVLPPWTITWRRNDRSFAVTVPAGEPGRLYGIVYFAESNTVRGAIGARQVSTREGWPGAAFVIDIL